MVLSFVFISSNCNQIGKHSNYCPSSMDVPRGRSRMQVVQVGIERRRGQNWAAKHHHYTYIAYGWRAPGNSSGRSCSVLINVHLECVIDHGEGMRVATAETWWLKGREDPKHIPKARQACNMPRAVPTQKRISRQPVIPSSVCKLYQGEGGGGGGICNVFHEWTLAFILKIDSCPFIPILVRLLQAVQVGE